MALKFLSKERQKVTTSKDSTLTATADKSVRKLEEYEGLVCLELSFIARILDMRFAHDYEIDDADKQQFMLESENVGRAEKNVSETFCKKHLLIDNLPTICSDLGVFLTANKTFSCRKLTSTTTFKTMISRIVLNSIRFVSTFLSFLYLFQFLSRYNLVYRFCVECN